ncbi:T-box-containing protein TBX6L-like isoform X2 [Saccostrea echinata]|uniref:T-box-containing protein TBX6L-like isoform X2 n=1 Tax=Saccostrea echinata TaxID=191078 RepID=UPI002A810743|nr:T-box-containing protein TBX6L-like isoform X2 [Saccostrea echinata]
MEQTKEDEAIRGADLMGVEKKIVPTASNLGISKIRYQVHQNTKFMKDEILNLSVGEETSKSVSGYGTDPEESRGVNIQEPDNNLGQFDVFQNIERSQRDFQTVNDQNIRNGDNEIHRLREGYPDQEDPFAANISEGLHCEREGVQVNIMDSHLWMAFNEIQTEMIINRSGRRMFPYLYISVTGLKSDGIYDILLDVLPADKRRFKFFNDAWVPVGVAEPQQENSSYVHPDSPSLGSLWMTRKISFARVKLTNSLESSPENIFLHSMHKYVIRITIRKRQTTTEVKKCISFLLRETNFIAVTAYQNSKITHLKILNNPFAKAFRGDKARYKRPRRRSSEKDRKADDSYGQGNDEVSDEKGRRLSESRAIFPWTHQNTTSNKDSEELSSSLTFSSESTSKNVLMSPYLLNAYRYNVGIYASIMAYHARLAELNGISNN